MDIVERLLAFHQRERERGGDMMTYGEGCPLAVEAAKEIEQLRSDAAITRRISLELYTATTAPAIARAKQ